VPSRNNSATSSIVIASESFFAMASYFPKNVLSAASSSGFTLFINSRPCLQILTPEHPPCEQNSEDDTNERQHRVRVEL
jgi:hypothetical protein